jgi:hypothetical protein
MDAIFKKLNYKDQPVIIILNSPESFSIHLEKMKSGCEVKEELVNDKISFILIFVTRAQEIKQYAFVLKEKLTPDPVLWFAYPKKSSRKYKSDINRDNGWQPLGDLGFEPVRQIAIDEDWSALRFRNPDFIKTMKRNPKMVLSKKGKDKLS